MAHQATADYEVPATPPVLAFAPDLTPIVSVPRGSRVRFTTQDACGGCVTSEEDVVKLEGIGEAHVVTGGNPASGPVEVEGAVRVVGLDQLVDVAREADAIVVTLPGATGTDGLVDAEVLGALRRGATVVNVGRGTVIDEDALIAALRDGVVGFAALDVTAVEPLPAGSPLWSMPNVLISPHTAALSPAEDRRIAELAAGNARRLLDGEPLRNLVRVADLR